MDILTEINSVLNESSFSDFQDGYHAEIMRAIRQLKLINEALKSKDLDDENIEKFENSLSMYNNSTLHFIQEAISRHTFRMTSHDLVSYAVGEVSRDGTEPMQLLNAIDDAYYFFSRIFDLPDIDEEV